MTSLVFYIYIKQLFFLISSILTCTLIGHLILGRKKEITYHRLFLWLFVGTLIFSSIYALIKTSLVSIHIIFGLLALWTWVDIRYFSPTPSQSTTSSQPSYQHVIISSLSGLILIFTWAFLQRIRMGDFPFVIPSATNQAANDYIINSFRSHFLGTSGQENYYHIINLFDPSYFGAKPYHYLEMWLNAGLSEIWGGLNVINMTLITFPLLYFLSFWGILALWEKCKQLDWFIIPLSLMFLFTAGFHLDIYDKYGYPAFSLPIMSYRLKMAVYYVFILGFVLQFLKGNKVIALLFLLGLVVATIVAAPAISGGIILFVFFALFLGIYSRKQGFRAYLYIFSVLAGIVLFYYFFDTGGPSIRKGTSMEELGGILFSENEITHLLGEKLSIFKQAFSHLGVLYGPFLLAVIVFWKDLWKIIQKQKAAIPLIFLLIIFCGAVSWAFFHPQKDATQLYYNLAIPLLNCSVILISIAVFSKFFKKKYLKQVNGIFSILLLIMVGIFSFRQAQLVYEKTIKQRSNHYFSNEYLVKIKEYIDSEEAYPLGAAIKGQANYGSPFSKLTAAYSLGYYLAYMKNGFVAISISDFVIPTYNASERRDVATGAFFQFVERQIKKYEFECIEHSQIDFIRQNSISYLIVSKEGHVSDTLMSCVKESYIDPRSKERFLILN